MARSAILFAATLGLTTLGACGDDGGSGPSDAAVALDAGADGHDVTPGFHGPDQYCPGSPGCSGVGDGV